MSWLFSRALVAAYSAGTCLDGEPFALLSGNLIPQAYCAPDKMTAFSRLSRFGMTYKPLTDALGEELLTSYLAGFPVRTSVQQDEAPEYPENDQECGVTWRESLGRYDRDSRSWKTHQYSLLGGLTEFSETWPRWGSMRNGELFRQQTLVPPTDATESGLWPTPRVEPGNFSRVNGKIYKTSLQSMARRGLLTARIWPTATARDWKGANAEQGLTRKDGKSRMDQLANAVAFATPQARDFRTGQESRWDNPTKTRNLNDQLGGQLNPTWVEWLMGWPLGWTKLKPLETDKYQQWLQQHGVY